MSERAESHERLTEENRELRQRVLELEARIFQDEPLSRGNRAGPDRHWGDGARLHSADTVDVKDAAPEINLAFRQAEAALRQSEQRVALHFEQTLLAAIEWDLEFRVVKWNPGAERVFGYSEAEALGQHVSLIVPPDVQAHVNDVWRELLLRRGGEHSTNVNITKEGRLILCEWYSTPLADDDGNVVAVGSLAEDITERKRAEAKLHASQRTLRTLIDASLESILLLDPDGTILVANETTARRLGRPLDDIVGRTFHDLLPPEVADSRMQCLQRVVRTGEPVRFEDVRFGRSIDSAIYPVHDSQGNVITLAILGVDQTDHKRDQALLKKAHEELEQKVKERTAELAIFRQFAEASGAGFGMSDLDGIVKYVNPTLASLLGETCPEDAISKHSATYYPEGYLQRMESAILPAIVNEGFWRGEMLIQARDGRNVPVLQSVFLVRDEDGNPARFAVCINDISELKETQANLERERQALRHMLQASDHERQTISYEIHDGLAQYLAAATMHFATHEALQSSNLPEAARAFQLGAELVHRAHAEARRLISQVRPPVIDERGVEVALAHLVHEFRRDAPGITLDVQVQFNRLHPLLENALYRIAQEALANVCKHSKSEKAAVKLVQRGREIQLEIRDWGVGFQPDAVPEGHFGLDGIRHRVKLLNGRLTIESTPGAGTVVQVVVPVVDE